MSETVLAALLSGIAAIIVGVINSYAQNRKIIQELDKHNELQAYQIQELDKKVNKHNQLIERVYKLEEFEEVEKEKIKVINHRIDDLEKFHK